MPAIDPNSLSLPDCYRALAASGLVKRLIDLARDEDLGIDGHPGDLTSLTAIPEKALAAAAINLRSPGTVAGLAAIPDVLAALAPNVRYQECVPDGSTPNAGTRLGQLSGPAREILRAERLILNLVGRLSGIATLTGRYRAAAGATAEARIFDTRKTTPGLRVLEKYAVRCGGGHCHRVGLFDAILLKDNHLAGISTGDLPEFVSAAARKARNLAPDLKFVMVEVDRIEQLQAIFRLPQGVVNIVLLDNMGPSLLSQAVQARNQHAPWLELEASGGVNLQTIAAIAATGVDRISVGAMTHQATSLDVGLDFES